MKGKQLSKSHLLEAPTNYTYSTIFAVQLPPYPSRDTQYHLSYIAADAEQSPENEYQHNHYSTERC